MRQTLTPEELDSRYLRSLLAGRVRAGVTPFQVALVNKLVATGQVYAERTIGGAWQNIVVLTGALAPDLRAVHDGL